MAGQRKMGFLVGAGMVTPSLGTKPCWMLFGSPWPTLSLAHGDMGARIAMGRLLVKREHCSQAPEPLFPYPLLPTLLGPPSESSPLLSLVNCQSGAKPGLQAEQPLNAQGPISELGRSSQYSPLPWGAGSATSGLTPFTSPHPIFCLGILRVAGKQGP